MKDNEYRRMNSNNILEHFNKKFEYHRENGPAREHSNGDKEWYKNGKRHRENGPAIRSSNNDYKAWYIDGKCHKEDGPAREWTLSIDSEWWYHNVQAKDKEEFYNKQWRKEVLLDLV